MEVRGEKDFGEVVFEMGFSAVEAFAVDGGVAFEGELCVVVLISLGEYRLIVSSLPDRAGSEVRASIEYVLEMPTLDDIPAAQ